ncbi:unnamed protein product [Phyllotreta striolata]|uniref:Gustatory receptor n=1 Tax=Phyllotreta striolata TaxID=444603 RepID=A0A9N9U1H3_PHYSR|nr:unnamed protein product [Phyllotreta striolata]
MAITTVESSNQRKTMRIRHTSKFLFFFAKLFGFLPFANSTILFNKIYASILICSFTSSTYYFVSTLAANNEIAMILTIFASIIPLDALIFSSHFFRGSRASARLETFLSASRNPFPYEQILFHVVFLLVNSLNFEAQIKRHKSLGVLCLALIFWYVLVFAVLLYGHVVLIFRRKLCRIHGDLKSVCLRIYPHQKRTVNDVLKMKEAYKSTVEQVENIECIFGHFLLLAHLFLLVQFVNGVHFIVSNLKISNVQFSDNEIYVFFSGIAPFSTTFIALVFSIMCCDLATGEGRDLIKTCYKLHNDSINHRNNEEVSTAILDFIEYITNFPPKFTSANFFDIQRTTILDILGIKLTYLIVVMQLDGV